MVQTYVQILGKRVDNRKVTSDHKPMPARKKHLLQAKEAIQFRSTLTTVKDKRGNIKNTYSFMFQQPSH